MEGLSGGSQLAIQFLLFRDMPQRSCEPNDSQRRHTREEHWHVPLFRPRWFLDLLCQFADHGFFSLDCQTRESAFGTSSNPCQCQPDRQAGRIREEKENLARQEDNEEQETRKGIG